MQTESHVKLVDGVTDEVVNDLNIQVATVNGSGSQSSNNILMRSIFQMGIPTSGKNLFPSNIAGLPTWFTIRASRHGYLACKRQVDVLVAMNRETYREDVEALMPGRVVVYEERFKLKGLRDDLIYYPVPFSQLASEVVREPRLRKLVANMAYVGSLSKLLGIELEQVELAIAKLFKNKQKAVDLNIEIAQIGAQYVENHLPKMDPFKLERMNKTKGKIIVDGNSACALGAMFGGVTVVTWYPITPASSLGEALTDYLQRYRTDPETGKATFAVVQAEDELAALGMAIGAGWAGARSMTSTSGPGISLMAEFTGLAYFAEIPCVIFDVQRVGPSTGLPTRTAQGDILALHSLSHGDTRHPVLLPGDMKECFEMSRLAFDLAERLQQPVFVGTDLDLGMNNWMSDPFEFPDQPQDRGKVLSATDLERLGEFSRYRDIDGDGIPYRTLPGTEHPLASYFTRGSGHDDSARYSERPEDYVQLMNRLSQKYETARKLLPQPEIQMKESANIGLIAYGSTHPAVSECEDQLLDEYGVEISYLRLRALPLSSSLKGFVAACERVYVVEQNRDGQMADLIRLEIGDEASKIRKICHYTGLPLDARFITDSVVAHEGFLKEED